MRAAGTGWLWLSVFLMTSNVSLFFWSGKLVADAWVCPYRHNLKVICVEYGQGVGTAIRLVYERTISGRCFAVFVNAEIVGAVYAEASVFLGVLSSQLSMLAVNMTTNATVTIPVDFELDPLSIYCYIRDDDSLSLVSRSLSAHHLYHCTNDVLPYGVTQGNAHGRFVCDVNLVLKPDDDPPDEPGAMLNWCPVWSPVGLVAGCVRYPSWYAVPVASDFWFHPAVTVSGTAPVTARLTLVGEVRPLQPNLFFTPSGHYMVVFVNEVDGEDISTKIQLVHFVRDPVVAIRVCQPEIPFFVDMNEIHSIALDDHLGVIYISYLRGYIFAVPFA
jgi:hypothetical protein